MSGQIYERKYVNLYIKIIGEGKLVVPDVQYTRERNTAKRSDKDKHGAPGGRKNEPRAQRDRRDRNNRKNKR